MMVALFIQAQRWLDKTARVDFLAPLLIRLYLVPVFWMAGSNKIFGGSTPEVIAIWYQNLQERLAASDAFWHVIWFPAMQSTIEWFGHPDWGLGLPFPALLAWLAALTEMVGALLLLAGLAVRWVSIPLMITMVVAALTVHWDHGWLAIAEGQGLFATERTVEAVERLARARDILREYGHYGWLTGRGSLVVLNNGIEFAATYFVLCLSLFFTGAGRWLSVDYWLVRHFINQGSVGAEHRS